MSSDEELSDEESGISSEESEDDDGDVIEESDSDDDKEEIGTTADIHDDDDDLDSEDEGEEEQTKGWFKQIEDEDEEEEGEDESDDEESPLDQSRRMVDEILTDIEKNFEGESESKDWEVVLKSFPDMTKLVEKCKKLSGHPPSNYIVRLFKFQTFLDKMKEKDQRSYFHDLTKRSKKALVQFRNILNKEVKLYSRSLRDYKRNTAEFLKKDLGREKKVEKEEKKKWWLTGDSDSDSDSDDDDEVEVEDNSWLDEEDSEESGEEGEGFETVETGPSDGKPEKGQERTKISAYLHERISWNDEMIDKKLDEYGLNVISQRHQNDLYDMFESTKRDDYKIRIQMLLINIAINQHNVNWYECCYRMLDMIDRIDSNPQFDYFVGAKVPDKKQQEKEKDYEETEGEEDKDKTIVPIICEYYVFVRSVFRGYVRLLQNTDRNTIEFIKKLSHEKIILNILERYFRHYERKNKFKYSQEISLHILYILHTRLEKDHRNIMIKRNKLIEEKLQKIKEKEERLLKKKEEEEERKRKEKEEAEAKGEEEEKEEEDVLLDQPPLEEEPKLEEEEEEKKEGEGEKEPKTDDSDLLEEPEAKEPESKETEEKEGEKASKEEVEGEGEEEEKEEEDLKNPFLPKIVLHIASPPLVLPSLNDTFRNIHQFVLQTRGTEEKVISATCYLICTCAVNNRFIEAKHLYLANQRKLAQYFLSHQRDRRDRDGNRDRRGEGGEDKKVKKEVSEQMKVLYNRTLTQFGMCAFRSCEFVDCCTILGDLHGNSQKKQLLSQAVMINPKTGRVEKSRLWPYHMTINLDILESYYLISLILLEIPIRKFVPFLHSKSNIWQDQTRGIFLNKRKRVRSFRNYATYYSRQIYSAPPKTTRELVFRSVKYILEKNDWKSAFECLKRLECWKYTVEMEGLNDKIHSHLLLQLKTTSLRNYLHRAGDIYDKLSVDFLMEKFEIPKDQIIQIVSEVIIKDGWNARIGGEDKEWIVLKQKNRKFNWSIYHSLNERTKMVNGDIFNVQ